MSYPAGIGEILNTNKDITLNPVPVPGVLTATDSGVAGVITGVVNYKVTFITATGETEVGSGCGDLNVTAKKVQLSSIPISPDGRVIGRKIYRKPTTVGVLDVVPYKLLTTINDNATTTYLDNTADGSLGALANRMNTTGGIMYRGADPIFAVDNEGFSIGHAAGYTRTAYASTAVGNNAMPSNVGIRNSAFGFDALNANIDGANNTAGGVHSLFLNTTGDNNTAWGYSALFNSLADNNSGFGTNAAANLTSGHEITAIGAQSLAAATTCLLNTAVGYNCLGGVTTTNANVGLGASAGALTNASAVADQVSSCVAIGYITTFLTNADTNSIVIGRAVAGDGSNTVCIGNSSIVSNRFHGVIALDKTVTAAGTTGARTINNPTGTVNFAAAAASLVVTNSFVTANSIIQLTVGTNDATMKSALAVAAAGSFTIFPNAVPTAETRVNFTITN